MTEYQEQAIPVPPSLSHRFTPFFVFVSTPALAFQDPAG
jgi:hypothetical protein